MSISVCDTKVSILLSLLLANMRILSCFYFLLLVMLSNFLIIPAVKEKFKVKLLLAIATGAPTTLINEMTDNPPVAVLKTIKILSMKSNAATYLLNFFLHDFLWLISWLK